jgi:thymidylate synthase (FAD)
VDLDQQVFKVLDNGFIELISYMGDDNFICDVARHTTNKKAKTQNDNERLIEYLLKNDHTSPFEFVEFVFLVKAPIFVARQWFRHRTGSYSEMSGRYQVFEPEFYIPELDRIKGKGIFNKQGSEGEIDENFKKLWTTILKQQFEKIKNVYKFANDNNVSNELARIVMPLSTYTQFYYKTDLHNLLHFLKLRMDSHAQWEIQQYANKILELIEPIVPYTIKVFKGLK